MENYLAMPAAFSEFSSTAQSSLHIYPNARISLILSPLHPFIDIPGEGKGVKQSYTDSTPPSQALSLTEAPAHIRLFTREQNRICHRTNNEVS